MKSCPTTDPLRRLLGKDGTRAELNRELCLGIKKGVVDYEDPALVEHLRRTTMGRLAIDNPRYSAYRRALSRQER
jgi:hypothetical protein